MGRAEELWDSRGRRIGLLAAQAGQHMHQVATSLREKADRLDQPRTVPGEQSQAPPRARTEEEIEDMWAEAYTIREQK
jgi:hypothetical protein